MGLDNYPVPPPCIYGKVTIIESKPRIYLDCFTTNCMFRRLSIKRDIFGPYCFFNGESYEHIVEEIGYSLYKNIERNELVKIYNILCKKYKFKCNNYEIQHMIISHVLSKSDEREDITAFLLYLTILLKYYDKWNGKLKSWY